MVGCAGRADHEIGTGQLVLEVGKRRGGRVEPRGQVASAGGGAIDDDHVPSSGLAEIPQGLGRHLAGADEQHPLVFKPLEHAAGEVGDSHARDRHPLPAEGRLGGDPLRGAERRLKHACRQRARRVAVLGDRPGLLHLRQDLRFAKHHAVEARGHAKQVPCHGLVVFSR